MHAFICDVAAADDMGIEKAEPHAPPGPSWGESGARLKEKLLQEEKAVRAEDYVRQLVYEAPPLTEDQRRRLATILQGGDAA